MFNAIQIFVTFISQQLNNSRNSIFRRKLQQYFQFKLSGVPFPRFCHSLNLFSRRAFRKSTPNEINLHRFFPPHKLAKYRNDKFQHTTVYFGGVPESKQPCSHSGKGHYSLKLSRACLISVVLLSELYGILLYFT